MVRIASKRLKKRDALLERNLREIAYAYRGRGVIIGGVRIMGGRVVAKVLNRRTITRLDREAIMAGLRGAVDIEAPSWCTPVEAVAYKLRYMHGAARRALALLGERKAVQEEERELSAALEERHAAQR